jgi:metallophosphoesterase superfamily enzyme
VVLVKGNHDVLPEAAYQHPNLTVYAEQWAVDPFLLTHQPVVDPVLRRGGLRFSTDPRSEDQPYNLAGHVHPGASVRAGMGQRVKLPCFYFTEHLGILPAFGQFTGCAIVQPGPNDQVFAVIDQQRVLPIKYR